MAKLIDLTGRTFGYLTVLHKEETEVVVDVVLDIPQLLREAADMMEKEQG